MATRTISATGGNYNDVAAWVEAAVPTSADDVVAHTLGVSGGNLTVNVNSSCLSADFTNYTGVLTINGVNRIWSVYGNLKFVAGMTLTMGSSAHIDFGSTSTGNLITTAGKSILRSLFNGVGGGWTLQDALTLTQTATTAFALLAGSLDANGQTVTTPQATISGTTARGLTLGASSVILNGAGTVWNATDVANLAFNAGTSTISITNTTASDKTFIGGGLTYYNLSVTTGGANPVIITGSNTFRAIQVTGGAAQAITFTAGTTTTISGTSSPLPSGAVGQLLTLQSSTPGTPWTLALSGNVSVDYVDISDCTVTGGILYAGTHSQSTSGGNTNVVFTDAPTSSSAQPQAQCMLITMMS